MSRDTRLSGRVVQPPDGPVSGVSVRLVGGDGDGETLCRAETDESGSYTLAVSGAAAADVAERAPTVLVGPADDPVVGQSVTETVREGGGELSPVVLPPGRAVGRERTAGIGSQTASDSTQSVRGNSAQSAGSGGSPGGTARASDGGQWERSSAAAMLVGGYGEDSQMPYHGTVAQRGMTDTPRQPGRRGFGRFQRLFDYLPSATHEPEFLEALGAAGGPMDGGERERPEEGDYPPAGYVFFGQFVDHDITLDPTSSLDRQNDPDGLRNFRTPSTDLDNVYGAGPEVSRHLYQRGSPRGTATEQDDPAKLLLRRNDAGNLADVPRNSQQTALLGDPRNDENLIVSQLQCSMLSAHNAIVDRIEGTVAEVELFETAQQLLRWHYQYLVLHDFLPRVCRADVLADVLEHGREFFTVPEGERPAIPLEFAGAAYRYGHSRIEERYRVNCDFAADLFRGEGGETLRGFRAVPDDHTVDWSYFFDVDDREFFGIDFDFDDGTVQRVAPIDTVLPSSLMRLPFVGEGPTSLASRNLLRGRRLGLPSGQAVARTMGVEVLHSDDVGFDSAAETVEDETGLERGDEETPLWFYVLGEAAELTDGARLGPVGSRIVAETLVGLIDENDKSYRTIQPNWSPEAVDALPFDDDVTVGELLTFGRSE
jgi:hypothetical protein